MEQHPGGYYRIFALCGEPVAEESMVTNNTTSMGLTVPDSSDQPPHHSAVYWLLTRELAQRTLNRLLLNELSPSDFRSAKKPASVKNAGFFADENRIQGNLCAFREVMVLLYGVLPCPLG